MHFRSSETWPPNGSGSGVVTNVSFFFLQFWSTMSHKITSSWLFLLSCFSVLPVFFHPFIVFPSLNSVQIVFYLLLLFFWKPSSSLTILLKICLSKMFVVSIGTVGSFFISVNQWIWVLGFLSKYSNILFSSVWLYPDHVWMERDPSFSNCILNNLIFQTNSVIVPFCVFIFHLHSFLGQEFFLVFLFPFFS